MFGDDTDRFEKDDIVEEKPLPSFSYSPPPKTSVQAPAAPPAVSGKMVTLRNLTKNEIPILIEDESGQHQERIGRLATFGPLSESSLTPQVRSLEVNKRIRIIES